MEEGEGMDRRREVGEGGKGGREEGRKRGREGKEGGREGKWREGRGRKEGGRGGREGREVREGGGREKGREKGRDEGGRSQTQQRYAIGEQRTESSSGRVATRRPSILSMASTEKVFSIRPTFVSSSQGCLLAVTRGSSSSEGEAGGVQATLWSSTTRDCSCGGSSSSSFSSSSFCCCCVGGSLISCEGSGLSLSFLEPTDAKYNILTVSTSQEELISLRLQQ